MKSILLLTVDLSLFDGEGGGAAAATGGEMGDNSTAGNTQPANSDDTRSETEGKTPSETLEDKRKAYNDLIRGEYKDFFTEDTQKIIDRRFKETKQLEKQLAGQNDVLDMLKVRYGVDDLAELQQAIEDDDSYWEQAAMENNMSVDQYKKFTKLERENRAFMQAEQERENQRRMNETLDTWYRDAEAIKQKYPGFDLETEVQNPDFIRMLQANVPMEHAYRVIHMDELINQAAASSAANAEKKTVDNIRARGKRPAENGTSSQSSFKTKDDVNSLTKDDRAEIVRRAARGEIISF